LPPHHVFVLAIARQSALPEKGSVLGLIHVRRRVGISALSRRTRLRFPGCAPTIGVTFADRWPG
jgi:hypothetical protein